MKNEIFDKMLDKLLDEAIPQYLEHKEYEDTTDVVFSERHNANMKKMFDDMKRKRKIQKFNIIARRVAVIVVAATALLVLFSPQILAWKSKIFDLFIQDNGDYSWTIFEEVEEGSERGSSTGQLSEEEKNEILSCFGYLPDGFEICQKYKTDEYEEVILFNSDFYITLSVLKNKSKVAIDTENSEYVKLNEANLVIITKKDRNEAVWMNDSLRYELVTNLDLNILNKIYQNINYSKMLKNFK